MLDIFNIPGQQDNIRIYYARGTNDWQTWQKPRNCKFIWIMCIGGATGAVGGQSGVGNVATTYLGGGGGHSGAVTRAIFPANALPDILYIQPGPGGAGGITSIGAVGDGARSFVSVAAGSTAVMNLVCVSGNAAATSPLVGNTAETAATLAGAGLLSLGTFTSTAGIQAVNQQDTTPLTSNIVTAGGFGGIARTASSTSFSMLATAFSPQLNAADVTSGIANNGVSYISWKPFFMVGGCGGGAFYTNAGNAGKGGDGAFGCGGGGGGAAFNGTGGNGGKGGDGLVIIATF